MIVCLVRRWLLGLSVGLLIGAVGIITFALVRNRKKMPAKPYMVIDRVEKCSACDGIGEHLIVQYGDTEYMTPNSLGELVVPNTAYIGRAWWQRCQDCHGRGERWRVWHMDRQWAAGIYEWGGDANAKVA